jgi:hypothetical protein
MEWRKCVFERRLQAWPLPFIEAIRQQACHGCHDAAVTPKPVVLPESLPSNAAAATPPMASENRTLGRRCSADSCTCPLRGNGRTHNEVRYPEAPPPEAGLVAMVGPNWKLAELPEVAILHLGQLTIEDSYSAGQPLSLRGR